MKISRLFHWLYAILMFLPVFVIPMFAINIINRSPEPLSVTTGGYEYNFKYETNSINNSSDLVVGNIYKTEIDMSVTYLNQSVLCQTNGVFNLNGNNYVLDGTSDTYLWFVYNSNDEGIIRLYLNSSYWFGVPIIDNKVSFYSLYYNNVNLTNINYFESDYNVVEYDYNDMLIYDDTDIGSQFLYSIYHSTDEYFNFSHVLGLDGIYNWFNSWFFNGSAPLGFYVFWLLLVYWFVISICWLVFDMLMFLPQLFHNWIDKARIE